ncbi:MAG TPA: hypothetical protein PLY93_04505 [Turneriella sp.]|nr:hypothetical protein [Turneriella sp.]
MRRLQRVMLKFVTTLFLVCVASVSPVVAQYLNPDSTFRDLPPEKKPAVEAPPQISPPQTPPPNPVVHATREEQFVDFAAYVREKNIILTWHFLTGRTNDLRVQIYRFTEEPKVIHDISSGVLVAKLTGDINLYEDVPPQKGAYYYAVFVETQRGLEPASFTPARNLVGPLYFRAAETEKNPSASVPVQTVKPASQEIPTAAFEIEEPEVERESIDAVDTRRLNMIIRKTYLKGKYREAIRYLKPYLRHKMPKIRAKAIFYSGLARYRLGEGERALKYFEHSLTQKYYRKNADFWINRIMENSR